MVLGVGDRLGPDQDSAWTSAKRALVVRADARFLFARAAACRGSIASTIGLGAARRGAASETLRPRAARRPQVLGVAVGAWRCGWSSSARVLRGPDGRSAAGASADRAWSFGE